MNVLTYKHGGDNIKNIAFQVDDELHIEIKIQATKEGKTIKDYIIELIKKDLGEKKK